MDIKLIDDYIASYKGGRGLTQEEAERIVFYRKLWGTCAMYGDMLAPASKPPAPEQLAAQVAQGKHLLDEFPAPIDKKLFLATIHELTDTVMGESAYPLEFRDGFLDMAKLLPNFIDEKNLVIAQSNPQDYLSYVLQVCGMTGAQEGVAPVMGALVALALRVQLEPYARMLMDALPPDALAKGSRPRTCPVCGSHPTVGMVHIGSSREGSFTKLACVQCGTTWEFEMLRCPHCGESGDDVMGYYNLNDDTRHLLGGCNKCGGYVRTLAVGENVDDISIDVEDVLLTRIDEALVQMTDPDNRAPEGEQG